MRVRFASCELDTDAVELRRNGAVVEIQPQVFAVLAYLAQHADRAVPKEELLDEIWGDRFVSESTLVSRIKFARRAVVDDGATQAIIKTVHGHGYRLVAEIEPVGVVPALESGPAASLLGAAAAHEADGWSFVGRVDELAVAASALERADLGGVLVRGPDRGGATRFADECRRRAEAVGRPTWWVQGMSTTTAIPLSAIAHLLPADVLDTVHTVEELVRADLFRRSHDALSDRAVQDRPVVVVDDAPLLDSLSAAVLGSLITSRKISAIVTGRWRTGDELPLDLEGFVQRGVLRPIELGPLDEVDIDVLLYRVLGGPIDDASLHALGAASRCRPGLLRDVVEASERAGVLVDEDGTWRLKGPPTSTGTGRWPPEELSEGAREVALELALLRSVDMDVLAEVADADGIDELDREGLLSVEGSATDARVSLVDRLLEATVLESTGPLRTRRAQQRLARDLPDVTGAPWALATIAGWDPALLRHLPARQVLDATVQALVSGDFPSAESLAAALDLEEVPAAAVVLAELAVLTHQWQRAEALLEDLDVDGLDPLFASLALRRRLGIAFTHRGRHDDALAELAHEIAARTGSVAEALRVRRLAYLAICGRYDELFDDFESVREIEGIPRVEALGSLAVAELGRGHVARCLELLDEAAGMAEAMVPAPWRAEAVDGLLTTRVSAHLQAGDLATASSLVDEVLPAGQRSRLGLLPVIGAEVAMDSGRPRYARELIRATVASSRRQEFPHYLGLAEAILARTDLAQGRVDAAAAGAEVARRSLADAPGVMRWRIASSLAELDDGLGRDGGVRPALLTMADEARATGALIAEADLLFGVATLDPTPETARRVVERMGDVTSAFEGPLWQVRLAHVIARSEDARLEEVQSRYRELGHLRFADRAARGR